MCRVSKFNGTSSNEPPAVRPRAMPMRGIENAIDRENPALPLTQRGTEGKANRLLHELLLPLYPGPGRLRVTAHVQSPRI